MFQKKEQEDLLLLDSKELKAYREQVELEKSRLQALKKAGAIKPEQQSALNDIALHLVDVDEVIEERKSEVPSSEVEKLSYVPEKGTEKMVHVKVVKGRRFNPNTGVEESTVYKQLFTLGEWQLFKKNYRGLGYNIVEVLYNPFDDFTV